MPETARGNPTRRYPRVRGPFDGYCLGDSSTPVLVYDLNLGGGFVNFLDSQPTHGTLRLNIDLLREGAISLTAEAIYLDRSGVAVRFVELDTDSRLRLARALDSLAERCIL